MGSTPKEVVKRYSSLGIIFKDGVDNLSHELGKYDIAIAPLQEGSGTRLKLLDFFASVLPTIGTQLSTEGLHESIASVMVIEDNIDSYARTIDRIINDRSLYHDMSQAGRNFVEKYYDWSNNLDPFLSIYSS